MRKAPNHDRDFWEASSCFVFYAATLRPMVQFLSPRLLLAIHLLVALVPHPGDSHAEQGKPGQSFPVA